jgi:hypothetical protein
MTWLAVGAHVSSVSRFLPVGKSSELNKSDDDEVCIGHPVAPSTSCQPPVTEPVWRACVRGVPRGGLGVWDPFSVSRCGEGGVLAVLTLTRELLRDTNTVLRLTSSMSLVCLVRRVRVISSWLPLRDVWVDWCTDSSLRRKASRSRPVSATISHLSSSLSLSLALVASSLSLSLSLFRPPARPPARLRRRKKKALSFLACLTMTLSVWCFSVGRSFLQMMTRAIRKQLL